jgi:hypothetical protein
MQTRSMTRRNCVTVPHTNGVDEYDAVSPVAVGKMSRATSQARRNINTINPYISNDECGALYKPDTLKPCRPEYEVNIDFNGAHDAWVANKCVRPNGCYVYKCIATRYDGQQCPRMAFKQTEYCRLHQANVGSSGISTEVVEITETSGCCCSY